MPMGSLPVVGTGNSVTFPDGVIWPIWFLLASVNQRFPSGPAAIPMGSLPAVGTANSLMVPDGVIRPMLLPSSSVNQRFPSGPATISLR